MTNRRIELHEYRQLIYRLRKGQSIREISRDTGFGRNKIKTVRIYAKNKGWLSSKEIPSEEDLTALFNKKLTNKQVSQAAPFAKIIHKWVDEGISATIIHQHLIENYDFTGGYCVVQRFIKRYYEQKSPDLTVSLSFKPGQAAQVDFGKGPKLYDERLNKEVDTWFFVMTLCWSRHQYVELVTHQDVQTWLQCHKNAFEWFNGVPEKIIIDNPKCAITKACYHSPEVQRSYEGMAENYSFIISACPPREPKKKGRVESGVKYVKGNFLPLKHFSSLQAANLKLKTWILSTAGNRIHGSVFEKPLTRFEEVESTLLKTLPVNPPELAVWEKVKLYRDCHVRYDKCCYSAPHILYGQELWLKATTSLIVIYCEQKIVAKHARIFKAGKSQTEDNHLPPKAQAFLKHDTNWCSNKSKEIGESCNTVIDTLLTDPVCDLLRQAQCILGLEKNYGASRLENACKRAIIFHTINYKTIKSILKDGLDYQQLNEHLAFDKLSDVYKGNARFQRHIDQLTQH